MIQIRSRKGLLKASIQKKPQARPTENPHPPSNSSSRSKAVTCEDLREKLRRKIELLRGEKKTYEKRLRNYDGRDTKGSGFRLGNYRVRKGEIGRLRRRRRRRPGPRLRSLKLQRRDRRFGSRAGVVECCCQLYDDPRLIKAGMKEKNGEKWKESPGKIKDERQKKKKTENIAGMINEKKMRKTAKGEKKLLRPGRNEEFVTKV